MNVLILGGITEARQIAQQIHQLDHQVIYSVAGLTPAGKKPVSYSIRRGGFGGVAGLTDYLTEQSIDLLIDATHPYAANISANADKASQQSKVPMWIYRRQAWQASVEDQWLTAADWPAVVEQLAAFKRPLFTIGLTPLSHLDDCLPEQQWFVRALPQAIKLPQKNSSVQLLLEQGPFTLDQERQLFTRIQPDVLIAKNSGGTFVQAKLQLAREKRIPVIMLERPILATSQLPTSKREFDSAPSLVTAFKTDFTCR